MVCKSTGVYVQRGIVGKGILKKIPVELKIEPQIMDNNRFVVYVF